MRFFWRPGHRSYHLGLTSQNSLFILRLQTPYFSSLSLYGWRDSNPWPLRPQQCGPLYQNWLRRWTTAGEEHRVLFDTRGPISQRRLAGFHLRLHRLHTGGCNSTQPPQADKFASETSGFSRSWLIPPHRATDSNPTVLCLTSVIHHVVSVTQLEFLSDDLCHQVLEVVTSKRWLS